MSQSSQVLVKRAEEKIQAAKDYKAEAGEASLKKLGDVYAIESNHKTKELGAKMRAFVFLFEMKIDAENEGKSKKGQQLTRKPNIEEKLEFLNKCIALNLDPFNNDIYGIQRGSAGTITINFKIYIKLALSDKTYDGITYERFFTDNDGNELPNNKKRIIVRAGYKDKKHPYEKEFGFKELSPNQGQGNDKPNYMFEKTATKLTLEQAFQDTVGKYKDYTPEELAGLDSDELDNNQMLEASVVEEETPQLETKQEEQQEELYEVPVELDA